MSFPNVRRAGALAITAVFAVTAPASAAGLSGTYKGDTNQNRTAHVKVTNGVIKQLSFSVFTACGIGGSGGYHTDVLLVKGVRVKPNGRYAHTSKGDSGNGYATFTIKGRITAKRATGSVEQFFRNGCQAFDLTFSARRR